MKNFNFCNGMRTYILFFKLVRVTTNVFCSVGTVNPTYCDANSQANTANSLAPTVGSFLKSINSTVTLTCVDGYTGSAGAVVVQCMNLNNTSGTWSSGNCICMRIIFACKCWVWSVVINIRGQMFFLNSVFRGEGNLKVGK